MNHDKPSLGDKIQSTLGPFASKVNGNIYITSVRDAMLAYMPFTFIASIFLIIAFSDPTSDRFYYYGVANRRC